MASIPREERVIATLGAKLNVRPEDIEVARNDARKLTDDQRDVGAAIVDAIRYVLVDDPERAVALGKVAARLFLPRRHRLEPLSALHQRSTITLANRFHLNRTGQSAVLAASWLAAQNSNPSATRRVPLLLRHEDVAKDLARRHHRSFGARKARSNRRKPTPSGGPGREVMTMQNKKIGFVGGGNMAGALIKGLLHSGTVTAAQIQASDVRDERLAELANEHGIATTKDNAKLAEWADVIVLAVKPQVIDKVIVRWRASRSPDALVISIAAGVPIESHRGAASARRARHSHHAQHRGDRAGGRHRDRAGTHASEDDLDIARQLFEATGRVVVLDETLLDAVTGLSGSGPAYIMLIIEALADGGVKVGLHRETALLLAAQTVYGSAKLLLETGEHPGRLKDMVTSPGGTAIAGLHTLEAGGLRTTLINAVENATRRSIELGEKMAEKLRKTQAQEPYGRAAASGPGAGGRAGAQKKPAQRGRGGDGRTSREHPHCLHSICHLLRTRYQAVTRWSPDNPFRF